MKKYGGPGRNKKCCEKRHCIDFVSIRENPQNINGNDIRINEYIISSIFNYY